MQRVTRIQGKAQLLTGGHIERKYLRVHLGTLKLLMAQQALKHLRMNVPIQQVHRKTVAERVRADTEFNSVAFRSIGCPDQPVPDCPVRNIPHRQGTTFTGDGVVLKPDEVLLSFSLLLPPAATEKTRRAVRAEIPLSEYIP